MSVITNASSSFQGYHLEHHRYQGHDVVDTGIPTELEARLFCNTLGKFVWVCFQPFFYMFRPLFTNPKVPIKLEYVNTAVQVNMKKTIKTFLRQEKSSNCQRTPSSICSVK